GSLLMFIENNLETKISAQALLDIIMYYADQTTQSSFGTGYWSDHWIYNLDLIEQYLAIFPDKIDFMIFDQPIKFYQSKISVYPIKYKYVLNKEVLLRQLCGLYEDKEKVKSLDLKQDTIYHKYKISKNVSVNLYSKLMHLATIITASSDP